MKSQKGFTLIELMVVVAVVAILAAIAYPSYQQHVVKSKRTAAESFMLTIANKEEQYMLDARSYTDSLTTLGLTAPSDVATNYTFAITGVSSAAYTITATPIGSQLANDTQCSSLSLNQAGLKTPATGCW